MRERAAKFNVEKIKPQDLAGAGGPPDEEAQEAVHLIDLNMSAATWDLAAKIGTAILASTRFAFEQLILNQLLNVLVKALKK